MEFDELMGEVMGMSVALERLAAAGTHLRSTIGCVDVDPLIGERIRDITALALPGADELPMPQREALAGVIVTLFSQAADLVNNPGRPPGWTFDDATVLQSTSRASMSVADVLAAVAPQLGDVTSALSVGGAFLDIGTGAGWLAIAAARHWPNAKVCGIDIHEPALAMARRSVEQEGLDARVELRQQDVCELPDQAAFDLAWVPGPFLPTQVVPGALDACHRAIRSGGWVAFGTYGGPDSAVAQQLADLRTVRSGGHPWTPPEAIEVLAAHGFEDVHEIERTWRAPVRLVAGRRP